MSYVKKMPGTAPSWLYSAVQYETLSGSHSYGVSTPKSDIDIVGFCVPPKEVVFPHLAGNIMGFGRQKTNFRSYDAQQVEDPEGGPVFDITIFNIVEYFSTCMDNNPNWLETLFTPEDVKISVTPVARHVLDNRHLFLHKGAFYRFTGFAKSQINKFQKNVVASGGELTKRGCKYGYHAVRLLDEVEQILTERALVLDQNTEKLMAIRNGEWSFSEVEEYFETKESQLETLYKETTALPHSPDEDAIKTLLLECLEEAYGSLEGCIVYGEWS